MKLALVALLLLMPFTSVAQEKPSSPAPKRITPEQIEDILDFESIDREKEEYIRKRLRKLDPRKDEEQKRVMIALSACVWPCVCTPRGKS